ncbi:MAG: NAD-dependent epimerase/dehydratase family protein [Polaromonas sp.]|nr:NAD-dependent epimerase/dehydratase family protein [Polaromonas sp.]
MSSLPPRNSTFSRPHRLAPAVVQAEKPQHHLIIGTGPVARAVGKALLNKGIRAHFVSRKPLQQQLPAACTHSVADAHDPKALRRIVDRATMVYHCAQPQAAKWDTEHILLTRTIALAAAGFKVPLLVPQSSESLGKPWASVMSNRHPIAPVSRRGRVLAQIAAELFAMRSTHALQFAIVRGGESFGPGITGGTLGECIFRAALRGRRVLLMGNPEASRSFNYIDDFGETLAALGGLAQQAEFWGRDWIAPQLGPLTPLQFAGFVRHALGQNMPTTQLGKADLILHAAFNRTARGGLSRYYTYNNNYILDGSDLQNRLAQKPTSMLEAMTQTLAWYRQNV